MRQVQGQPGLQRKTMSKYTYFSKYKQISILRDLKRMAMIGCRIPAGQLDPMSDKLTTVVKQ